MDYLGIMVMPILIGMVLHIVVSAGVKTPGAILNQKFVSLGILK